MGKGGGKRMKEQEKDRGGGQRTRYLWCCEMLESSI
jgi:hypothetical protein